MDHENWKECLRRRLYFLSRSFSVRIKNFIKTENELLRHEGDEEDLCGEGINLTVHFSESSLNAEDEFCPHWS